MIWTDGDGDEDGNEHRVIGVGPVGTSPVIGHQTPTSQRTTLHRHNLTHPLSNVDK